MLHNERIDKVVALFRSDFNCSQSVFSVYAAELGINEVDARRVASGFGAGMGVLQKTCGAVTGGVMVLGARYFDERDIAGTKMFVYKKVRRLVMRFEAKHGTVECFPLLGVDITTEEGLAVARERNLFHLKCEPYVKDVCAVLEELLRETGANTR